MKKVLIFAYQYKDKHVPEYIIDDLEESLQVIEYYQVEDGDNYQIWEYPSGKIYKIEPDRKVEDKDAASPPGKLWMPKLTLLETDKGKVKKAYEDFMNVPEKKSLIQKIKSSFRK